MPFIVKLKKANTLTLARFDARPSWGDLASEIADLFRISSNHVGVVFIDEAKNAIILTKEQELQSFYKAFDPFSGKLKFVVQDLQNPDSPTTIASTWSDNKLTLFCWVLNVSNSPFAVDIRKSKTVDDLKKAIKKEKKHTFSDIDADTLQLWKLSPLIPSVEIDKLRDVQSPQQIPGCDKLNVFDKLSEYFSLAPRGHLHIIVETPFTRNYSRDLFIFT
ncbi:hypothetical protein F5887DRAFT_1088745 [Amanita rubescens]|nr:hypothetical protein F5887DRAFT_1088745 [Amanita rubescens]